MVVLVVKFLEHFVYPALGYFIAILKQPLNIWCGYNLNMGNLEADYLF